MVGENGKNENNDLAPRNWRESVNAGNTVVCIYGLLNAVGSPQHK